MKLEVDHLRLTWERYGGHAKCDFQFGESAGACDDDDDDDDDWMDGSAQTQNVTMKFNVFWVGGQETVQRGTTTPPPPPTLTTFTRKSVVCE